MDNLAVELYAFFPYFALSDTHTIRVLLEVNGQWVWSTSGEQGAPIEWVEDGYGVFRFLITDLNDHLGFSGITTGTDVTNTVRINVSPWFIPEDDALYVCGAAEAPSGIVFNAPFRADCNSLLTMLAEYGRLSLADVLAPAIQMADGYPIEAQAVGLIQRHHDRLKQWRPRIERNLDRMSRQITGQPHERNLQRWRELVDRGDLPGLHRILTGLDRDSIEMREVSPMGGLLTQEQRSQALAIAG
jgi:hypothetical protein